MHKRPKRQMRHPLSSQLYLSPGYHCPSHCYGNFGLIPPHFSHPVIRQVPLVSPHLPFFSVTTTTLVQILAASSQAAGAFCLQDSSPVLRPISWKHGFHHVVSLWQIFNARLFFCSIFHCQRDTFPGQECSGIIHPGCFSWTFPALPTRVLKELT